MGAGTAGRNAPAGRSHQSRMDCGLARARAPCEQTSADASKMTAGIDDLVLNDGHCLAPGQLVAERCPPRRYMRSSAPRLRRDTPLAPGVSLHMLDLSGAPATCLALGVRKGQFSKPKSAPLVAFRCRYPTRFCLRGFIIGSGFQTATVRAHSRA
jgi:hypothetical protein